MFRKMRLAENQISEKETIEILERNTNGVLALDGDEGYTYALPLSYAYVDGKIYFHGARGGHKIDAIKKNNKLSFCVVDKDEILPEKFNSLYSSAIVFGKIKLLENDGERQKALEAILKKYSANFFEGGLKYIEAEKNIAMVLELSIEHMTGKKGL